MVQQSIYQNPNQVHDRQRAGTQIVSMHESEIIVFFFPSTPDTLL